MSKTATKPGKWLGPLPSDTTVLAAARSALTSRVNLVAGLLPKAAATHEGNQENVHQLRVMSRRAEAVLTTFADLFPQDRAKNLRKRLRQVRKSADAARNLDVFLERLAERDNVPADYLREIRERRGAAQSTLVGMSGRLDAGKKLRRKCRRLMKRTPGERGSARMLARREFEEWALGRTLDAARRLFDRAPEGHDPTAWHRFRVAAKRTRYTLELLADALPPEVRQRAYPALVDAQQRLGEMNDHATAAERLPQWGGGSDYTERLVAEERDALEASQNHWRRFLEEGGLEPLRTTLLEALGSR